MFGKITRYVTITGLVLLQVWGITACGKKGPPRPPGYQELPVVNDLRYQITEDMLILEWTVPGIGEDRGNAASGAKVYRFKTPVKDAVCKDCPVTLSFIADVPFTSTPMLYEEKLEKGYRYVYQVFVYDKNGQTGERSNIVDFVHN
jgi:hypothetical protein